MDFSWTEQQTALREAVIRFARAELNTDLVERDRAGEFNRAGWRKCGEFGIQGLLIPADHGGRGADPLTAAHVLEGLGYACRDNGLLFSIHAHMWACLLPVLIFGTERQKQKYLPQLCNGTLIGSSAMTESGSGSDAFGGLRTTAQKDGDHYVLNGTKTFITNAPVADVVVVFATIDPARGAHGITAFLVDRSAPGLSVRGPIAKMGLATAPMGQVILDNCRVPGGQRLGNEGSGVAVFTHAMEWERAFILASAVGAMERQLETCIQYARRRQQFGKPIGKFQLVAGKIVDMKLRLETARALLYKVVWLKAQDRSALLEAALAKLYLSECWVASCMDAMQVHGGYGYLTECELERDLRDALGSKFYSGTSEMQRVIIAQFLGL
jgi:alkylation response protein AidB-like acyl-CoA dehydrogenase